MFAKFYEIPSLPFQDIEKPKCCGRTGGWMDQRTDNVKTVYPLPPQTQFAGGINMTNTSKTFLYNYGEVQKCKHVIAKVPSSFKETGERDIPGHMLTINKMGIINTCINGQDNLIMFSRKCNMQYCKLYIVQ